MNIGYKILKFTGKALVKLVKFVFYPLTYAYRKITKRIKRTRRDKKDFPGIYVVSNND
jgi:hypothetical protein